MLTPKTSAFLTFIAAALLVLFLLSPEAIAQQTPPVAMAKRATESPAIDGVLDERVWQEATPLTDFVQSDPAEGKPATEKTEVRILYDDEAIYVGVICYDNNPSRILITDTRRDSGLGEMDSFQMIFDTFHDLQRGFIFGTNAAGTEYDAQFTNEGEVLSARPPPPTLGRQQAQAGTAMNVDWNASWEVKTRVSEIGWTAEFRIPLRTLRYASAPQVWGLNFSRNIYHKREQVYWAPLQRIYTLTRLVSAGELRGLGLPATHNFQVTPYLVGSANRNFAASSATNRDGDWGLDSKIGVTPSLNLDLTYNTDFAQVEADDQQINLSRFNLIFPEKRPFFLENRGLFAVGKNGQVDFFFSRRIGITDTGTLVPIQGGARLTGKAAGANIGLLNIQTKSVGNTPANNFTAARINKELPNRSSIGAIFINRAATGSLAGTDNWNSTYGVDGRLGIGEELTFTGFAGRTETPGRTGREYAFGGGYQFRNRQVRNYIEYNQIGEDFNPEVGFLERNGGFRRFLTGWHEAVRSKALAKAGIREMQPHIIYEGYWGWDGELETASLHMDGATNLENTSNISPAFNIDWEGLERPFEVYPGVIVPPGHYRSAHVELDQSSDRRRWFSGQLTWKHGGFLSGDQNALAPSFTLRRGGDVSATFRWTRSHFTLPQGTFTTNLGSFRALYNFSPALNAQALIQYNDRTDRWSTNVRFGWVTTAGTGLFVVYNDTEALNGLGPVNRSFILKFSRQFDLLQ